MLEHPNSNKKLALSIAVKSMNDTLGLEGLVPSALVFGEYPQVHTRSEVPKVRVTHEERAALATTARKEMEKHMAQLGIKCALRHAKPPASMRFYQPGDKVLVWKEKQVQNRIGEWLGPFLVVSCDEPK